MSTYNVLIVDDEIENIGLLKIYLDKYCKSIGTIYTATNVEDATNSYLEHQQDILLLDIELGNTTTSFSILKAIPYRQVEVIFITAHKEYAIEAINSIQTAAYLIKPVKPADLAVAIDKVIKNIETKSSTDLPKADDAHVDLIAIPSTDKIEVVNVKDIVYLEADGKYTRFFLINGSSKMASRNLGEYEKQLDSNIFFRIHRSYIVNLNMVIAINKTEGNYCELINGKSLAIAKRKQDLLHRFLKIK